MAWLQLFTLPGQIVGIINSDCRFRFRFFSVPYLLLLWDAECYIYFLVEDIQWNWKCFKLYFMIIIPHLYLHLTLPIYIPSSTLKRFSFGRLFFVCCFVVPLRLMRELKKKMLEGHSIVNVTKWSREWFKLNFEIYINSSPTPLIILYCACLIHLLMFFL